MKRVEPRHEKVSQAAANVTSAAKAKMEEAQEGVQKTLNSAVESVSGSSESSATPASATPASSSTASSSPASVQSTQTQMNDSAETVSLRRQESLASGVMEIY